MNIEQLEEEQTLKLKRLIKSKMAEKGYTLETLASALKENYCVHCKDEGTYLYEEENKCVLDCNDRKRKL